MYVLQYMYTHQGHGHEEFLQGGGHGGVMGCGYSARNRNQRWYKNQPNTGSIADTMVIDRGFLGKDGV